MKKSLQILPHILAFILLGAFKQSGFTFVFVPSFFILYALCLFVCPVLALCKLSKFCKASFYTLLILLLCGLIFAAKALFGIPFAITLLSISSLLFSILLVNYLLPEKTKETEHLEMRGLTNRLARRKVLLRQSYALFLKKSGAVSSLIGTYLLLIFNSVTKEAVLSMALYITAISFIGNLLYGLLGSPMPQKGPTALKSGRILSLCIMAFLLLLISAYIYIGSFYTSPDPALREALTVCKRILTASYIGFGCSLIGVLFGLLLSMCGVKFFKTIFNGPLCFSLSLFAALLYPAINARFFYPEIITVCISLFILGTCTSLTYRTRLVPYKELPLLDKKASVTRPFYVLPVLASLPVFLTEALFISFFIQNLMTNLIYELTALSQILSGVMVSCIFSALIILCILTKEVRHNG